MTENDADITCEYCGLPFSPDDIAEHYWVCKDYNEAEKARWNAEGR